MCLEAKRGLFYRPGRLVMGGRRLRRTRRVSQWRRVDNFEARLLWTRTDIIVGRHTEPPASLKPKGAREKRSTMASVSIETHREQMLQALEAGQPGRFLRMVSPYLALQPADDQVRLLTIREYLRRGLVGPARELIDADAPPDGPLAAELAQVYASIRNLPGGPLAWSTRRERFERNLEAIERIGVDPTMLREAWNGSASRFELFVDGRGVDQVRIRDASCGWRWISDLGDHQAHAAQQPLPAGLDGQVPMPVLFDGIDLGWLFERVYRKTHNTFNGYSCALFVVEPDPTAIALVLHLHDWDAILRDPRVFWMIGSDWEAQLRCVWDRHRNLPFPVQILSACGRPPASPSVLDIVNELGRQREHDIQHSLAALNERYAARGLTHAARRFAEACAGTGPPLRILAAVSTHTTFLQYAVRDAKRAFESLGHECVVLSEQTPYEVIAPLTYHETIKAFDPDVFFVLDHLRHEFTSLIPTHLPLLCWDQDELPHVFTAENIRRIPVQDFVVGWTKYNFVRAGGRERQYFATHIPTCPDQYGDETPPDDVLRRYGCDVSYVSHASQTPEQFHEQERNAIHDPRGRRLLDALFEMAPAMLARYRVMEVHLPELMLEEASRRCGVSVTDEAMKRRLIGWYLWRLGDRLFRHEALQWVADWARRRGASFRLYGNGWDRHPTLSEFAAGPAQNGRELLCVFRASRINLQLMPAGFIHQRALDGLMSGGFFLTRQTPQDRLGGALSTLADRIAALGIQTTRELIDCHDDTLQNALQQYIGRWLHRFDPDKPDLFRLIVTAAEMPQALEVFPDLPQITFDTPEEFERAADRFLQSPQERHAIAQRMKAAVAERFTYGTTMRNMLAAMSDYLQWAAGLDGVSCRAGPKCDTVTAASS